MCVPCPEHETAGWWICRRCDWKNACLGVLVAVLHHKHLKSHFVGWFWSLIEAEMCKPMAASTAMNSLFLSLLEHLFGISVSLTANGSGLATYISKVDSSGIKSFRMKLKKEEGGYWGYNIEPHPQDVYSNNYIWMCTSDIFFSWLDHKMTQKIRRQSYILNTCESALSSKITSGGIFPDPSIWGHPKPL